MKTFLVILHTHTHKHIYIYINRARVARYSPYSQVEKKMLEHIDFRAAARIGLRQTKPDLMRLARFAAKELGISKAEFKCSRNFIQRFAKRHQQIWRYKTTNRQQSIESFLQCWIHWIKPFRIFVLSIGLVTPFGYIRSPNIWNCDEWALEPDGEKLKHMVPINAKMVNAPELCMTPAIGKRIATITGIVPKCGFPDDC